MPKDKGGHGSNPRTHTEGAPGGAFHQFSDMGRSLPITDSETGKRVGTLPRYGVWSGGKVKETFTGLNTLRKKYGNVNPVKIK